MQRCPGRAIAPRGISLLNRSMPIPEHCPADPEETAEAYLHDTLPATEERAFYEHYVTCPGCNAILDAALLAMKQAAERIRELEK